MSATPIEAGATRIQQLEAENAALLELLGKANAALAGVVDVRALAADIVQAYHRVLGAEPPEGKALRIRTAAMVAALSINGARVAVAIMPTRFEVG